MAARAIWKAHVSFEAVDVPVKLYSAVEDRKVHFRLLHAEDGVPVQQRMIDPTRGEPVEAQAIRKGLRVDQHLYVVLEPEELQALQPEPSRVIEVERFVPPARLDPRWFDRPYYLGPDGDEAAYFGLAQALGERGRLGIAHWVMRHKHQSGALESRHGYLVLNTLRHTEALVPLAALRPPEARQPEPEEIALAEQLLRALEGDFDPAAFHDEYRERLLALIEAKAEGEVIELPTPPPRPAAASLIDSLQASLARAREARTPAREAHSG